jgi:FlaA1/EpsC-like NDP-sugar epimerase
MHSQLRNILLRNSHRFVSPYLVLALDVVLVMMAFIAAYMLRFNFVLSAGNVENMFKQLLVYAGIQLVFFLLLKTHRGIIRHTGLNDVFRLFVAVTLCLFSVLVISSFFWMINGFQFLSFSTSILLIAYMASLMLLFLFRFGIKVTYLSLVRIGCRQDNALVFGAGEMGIATQNTIKATTNSPYRVVGFIDDNPGKQNKLFSGVMVYVPTVLNKEFLQKRNISHIILAVQNMPAARRKEIIEQCLELDVKLLTVPGLKDWHEGRLRVRQIRKVQIQELLQRSPIKINNSKVGKEVAGKVVMVTGAAGSIGSELARQIRRLNPQHLILLDQAETPLFELEQEFLASGNGAANIHYVLGDVSHAANMRRVFRKYRPEIIYHAAAYKHVPMIENNPLEALRVNVFGTRNMALLAFEFHASDFVLISTDKAVNPTSFMGVSKRLAEMYVQSLGNYTNGSTRFITTRFGNVLGSNGSVIPIFEKQIAKGGPVTVTHPDMKRFFMTIPEACELVLEASIMGHDGQILVFDMGEQVRIIDVARKMIRLSGLEPDKDIDVVITGLRPGEKLYEELFNDTEETLPTHHPKIMIARVSAHDFESVSQKFDQIETMVGKRQLRHVVAVISEIMPEYRASTPGKDPIIVSSS